MSDENPSKPNLIGQIKDKLIQSKEDWAREGRLLTGRPDMGHVNRLPPGQKEVKNWPVLDLGVQPDIRREAWRLEIGGLVEKPFEMSLKDLMKLPGRTVRAVTECAGNDAGFFDYQTRKAKKPSRINQQDMQARAAMRETNAVPSSEAISNEQYLQADA